MRALAKEFVGFYISRVRRNYPGFLREFYPYLVLAVAAAFLDFASTVRFMVAEGVEEELHPVIGLVAIFLGPVLGPLVGKVCQLLALALLTITFRPYARIILIPVSVAYLYAAWYNTWGADLYTPLFLRLLNR